jgi:hypothetical protein
MSIPSTWKLRGIVGSGHIMRRNFEVSYSVPAVTTEADILSAVPLYTAWKGESGYFAPVMQRYRLQTELTAGRSLVVYYYETPNWNQVLVNNPHHAILLRDTSLEQRKTEGDYTSPTPVYWWREGYEDIADTWVLTRNRPLNGTVATFAHQSYRLQVVLDAGTTDAAYMTALEALGGTVNAATVNYLGATAGTLKGFGMTTELFWTTKLLTKVDMRFSYNSTGWNDTGVKENWTEINLPVLNDDGSDADTTTAVGYWRQDGSTYPLTCNRSVSWTVLDTLLAWLLP